ncbi:TonB-dependent receptor [Mucilaginibacter daejeonensis]|uniref:TonB-dependent receptor n=1 Tax=Mucilaginibacter daejeonensis TaxID=398049 RepID=UPI001D1743F1|nr:TonB-dependent receptor [Mucilaginibacter daejeonensis]UEG54186.1 TonB-dependent receptor [Mucilaginibacter daejeonensis]
MKRPILLICMLLYAVTIFAQDSRSLKGKVTDKNNEPLVGATVQCLTVPRSTGTDVTGTFTLSNLPAKNIKIRVSYTGFAAVERTVDLSAGNVDTLNVTLTSGDAMALTEVVVTAVNNQASRLNTSLSVSSVKLTDIAKAAPRTTAEIFKSIPGIRAEASGGDGNTNITVRGVPLSSGGSKYLQLQEDGLPVLQFGDISFGTADIFLRADQNINRIEAIRGGSASTLATNSPAGIINFLSKTGNIEGGTLSTTVGLDYQNFRTDFDYGAPVGNGVSFHVGGFFRQGQGPRTAGFQANNGGQFKANLTKQFSNGYARVYLKFLDDRAAAYLPMPVSVTGTNSDPKYSSLSGFDIKHGALQSPYLLQTQGLGADGNSYVSDIRNGMHPLSKSIGTELQFDLGNNWTIEDRGRASFNSGQFIAPFPASAGPLSAMLTQISSATGRNLTGATVTSAVTGQAYNGQAMIMHIFDAKLNNFNNFINDFKLKKKIDNVNLTAGYYKSSQNIDMDWQFNSYLTSLEGKNAQPLNITAGGVSQTTNGLFAYGVPVWGNLHRNYNTSYDISAPYAGINIDLNKKLNIDGSIRYDMGRVRGNYSGNVQRTYDVNNDGVISANEQSVSAINYSAAKPVNYNYNYVSYSVGLNYLLDASSALFARYSSGASAQADRILFTPTIFADGSAAGKYNRINQGELGIKYKYNGGGLFLTGFYAHTDEAGEFEVTTQRIIQNSYRSFGAELEGVANLTSYFDLRGNVTYTHARIVAGTYKGNKPRRQADVIYSLTPTFNVSKLSMGASILGTTSSFTQDVNALKLPAYVYVNPFIMYQVNKRWSASVNGNNIFNVAGFTEAEDGSIVNNQSNIVRARSITGRTVSATVAFNF